MSLLWHDGFGTYISNGQFGNHYTDLTAGANITYRATGRHTGSRCISMGNPSVSFRTKSLQATGGAAGRDAIIIGFAAKLPDLSQPNFWSQFLNIISGSYEQIRVNVRVNPLTAKYFFEIFTVGRTPIITQGERKLILRTKEYDRNVWYFFELRVLFSQSLGEVQWRVGGYLESEAKDITETASGSPRGWNIVRFNFDPNVSEFSRAFFTDLYILNEENGATEPRFARFLGDVACSTIYPDPSRAERGRIMQWQNTAANITPYRFVVLAGQSNMDGYTTALNTALPGSIRDPNPKIQIWDVVDTDLKTLDAGDNNARHFEGQTFPPPLIGPYHGPEMSFAEQIAAYYEKTSSNSTTPAKIKVIKAAKNNTTLYTGFQGNSWQPRNSTYFSIWGAGNPYSLYDGDTGAYANLNLKKFLNDAAADVGGWGNVECIDFIWYQGESDAFEFGNPTPLPQPSLEYYDRLVELFDFIRADFTQASLHFHLAQINKNLISQPSHPDITSRGFIYKDAVRQAQELYADAYDDTTLIDLDSIPLAPDGTHYDPDGYKAVGEMMFDSWLKEQPFASLIDDYVSSEPDNEGVVVHEQDKDALFLWGPPQWLRNSEILAVRHDATGNTLSTGSSSIKTIIANAVAVAVDSGTMTYSTSTALRTVNMIRSPLGNVPFREEDFQNLEIGFRSA